MKKCTRLFAVLGLCLTLAVSLVSCSDGNGYSLDKFWVSTATVTELGNDAFYFTLDNGTTLWVAASATNYKPKSKRVVINYTILSDQIADYDHSIRLNGYLADILIKDVIYISPDDTAKQDSIGNDPIKIISILEGGGYLNIKFKYNIGGGHPHLLNLVSSSPDLSVNDDLVKLELRHNQNNDSEYRPAEGYINFNIAPYRVSGRDRVNFEISVKDFSGETKVYAIEYIYSKAERNEPSAFKLNAD